VSEPVVLSVQYRYTPGLLGKRGCKAIPSSPRSEPKLTARSSAVPWTTPFTIRCTRPVFFSSTRTWLSPTKAMVVGVTRPPATVLTPRLGSTIVGPST
jgi:hypothetical protein